MATERKAQRLTPLGINFPSDKYVLPKGYSAGVAFTTQGGEGGGLDTSEYRPPHGYQVGISFSAQLYVAPPGYAIGIEFGTRKQDEDGDDAVTLAPEGIDWPGAGEHKAQNQHEFIKPSGLDTYRPGYPEVFNSSQFMLPAGIQSRDGYGSPEIWNVSEQMWTHGWSSHRFGQSHIWNLDQYIKAGGVPSKLAWGRPSVWLYTRYLKPGGFDVSRYGTQWASHYLREVIASRPGDFLAWGRPWAVEDPRYLNPKPVDPPPITDNHMVGGLRFIYPVGNEMTEWGTRIIPEAVDIYTHGRSAMEFGDTEIKNRINYIKPEGFKAQADEELRFGYQYIWNLKQVVRHEYDPNDELNPPPFGQWTAIENRNKEPQAHGWTSSRFGYQFIWNKATPILPPGIEPPGYPEYYETGTITHRHRPIHFEGIDSLTMTRWGVVTNLADPLLPDGFDSMDADSRPAIENRSRKFDRWGNFETMALGTPFIADAIRELSIEPRYAIQPPRIELPTIDLHTRYIDEVTLGDPKYGVGHPGTTIRWTIIHPRWAFHPPAFIGEPSLHNVTPELGIYGHDSAEFGTQSVRTQWREVLGIGERMDLHGRPIIRDRRHWVEFTGALPPPNVMPGPVVTRIGGVPDNYHVTPAGIFYRNEADRFGRAFVGAQELYPSGFDPLRMGNADVHANSIRVEPGLFEHKFGDAWFSLKNRVLDVKEQGIKPVTDVGKPRSTPHTLYAVFEAPQQAKDNHPYQELHYVDHDRRTNRSIKGVGNHRISQDPQYIRASGFASMSNGSWWFGSTKIHNALSYISTQGIQAARYGMPYMLPHDQETFVYSGIYTMSFGQAKVVRPPYTGPQYVTGRGFSSMVFGTAYIDLLHRQRDLAGFDSLLMGESKRNDTPYQWQGLRIGPLVPTMPPGFDPLQFGPETWVSHWVRQVDAQGTDFFASEYDYTNFEARMRVWRHKESPPMQMATAAGFETSSFGYHEARNRAHYIRPDGNAEVFRKGAGNA